MNDAKVPGELVGFKEEIANVQTAIADFESGQRSNVAIIAEPFAGRTTMINAIEKMNLQKVTRVSFSSVVKSRDEIRLPEGAKRIIIFDDCQFLYTRRIGGFDVLEEFLKSVASSGNMFITSWNLYSWKYLDETINIGRYFPVQINLPKFTAGEIRECILSRYKSDEIKFMEDVEFEKEKMIEVAKHPVSLPFKRSISIPFLKIHYALLKIRLFEKEKKATVEDIIFEKISRISDGNPGVAKVIWQRSLEYPVIKPGRIKEQSFAIELDYSEAFILSVILSMKSLKEEELAEIAGYEYELDRILFRLGKQGLVALGDGYCGIKPEALSSTVEFLKRLRLVW